MTHEAWARAQYAMSVRIAELEAELAKALADRNAAIASRVSYVAMVETLSSQMAEMRAALAEVRESASRCCDGYEEQIQMLTQINRDLNSQMAGAQMNFTQDGIRMGLSEEEHNWLNGFDEELGIDAENRFEAIKLVKERIAELEAALNPSYETIEQWVNDLWEECRTGGGWQPDWDEIIRAGFRRARAGLARTAPAT